MSSTITPYSPSNNIFPSSSSAPNANTKVFFGFSTVNTDKTGKTALYDLDLINRDLYNAFYTRVGERVMRPDFGCSIWDMLFEPLTPLLHDQIVAEVIRICQSDSRLNILDTQVYEYENGLRIEMSLQYLPWKVVASFTATFENRQAVYFNSDSET